MFSLDTFSRSATATLTRLADLAVNNINIMAIKKIKVKPTMLYIPVEKHKLLKSMAASERTSLTRLVESAIDKFLLPTEK